MTDSKLDLNCYGDTEYYGRRVHVWGGDVSLGQRCTCGETAWDDSDQASIVRAEAAIRAGRKRIKTERTEEF